MIYVIPTLIRLYKKIFPEPKEKVEAGRKLAAKYGVQAIYDAAIDAGYSVEEALGDCDIDVSEI